LYFYTNGTKLTSGARILQANATADRPVTAVRQMAVTTVKHVGTTIALPPKGAVVEPGPKYRGSQFAN